MNRRGGLLLQILRMSPLVQRGRPREPEAKSSPLGRLPGPSSDREIVAALCAQLPSGGAALYDRYQRQVRRVLYRVLGHARDLADLEQETFVSAIHDIASLKQPDALGSWLTGIAVNTARLELRRRARRRLFRFGTDEELPEVEAPIASPEIDEALRATYRILNKMPADERIAFALRFIDGMELLEVASACAVSLSTAKRRLHKARERFDAMAAQYDELSDWAKGRAT